MGSEIRSEAEAAVSINHKIVACYARPPIEGDFERRFAPELEILRGLGDLSQIDSGDRGLFMDAVSRADAVITNWGIRFGRDVISRMKKCRIIAVGAVGVDMVDLEAATDFGVVVTNAPDTFIEEVADHAMMLLLAGARRTGLVKGFAASDQWTRGRSLLMKSPRLMGSTLGLLGYGNAARATARRAKPFGLRLIAHDPYLADTVLCADEVEPVGFAELLEQSDYLSLHTPLNDETHHIINAQAFGLMKKNAILVNTARGSIIDETALINALNAGEIAGAGLDVLEQEPPDIENPLLHNPDVIVTPHVASASTRMLIECRRRAARQVALVLRGKWPMSCVNPRVLDTSDLTRWQPYSTERGPNR